MSHKRIHFYCSRLIQMNKSILAILFLSAFLLYSFILMLNGLKTANTVNIDCGNIDHKNNYNNILADLSIKLNQAIKKIAINDCQNLPKNASSRGGWCAEDSGKNSTHYIHDTMLSNALSQFFIGKRVVSFGDGRGYYKREMDMNNEVKRYDAFDGAPYLEESTNGSVRYLDVSVPVYHLERYDWVLSLEVAEHIPKEFEATFVDNVKRHALEGIVLSWAMPNQPGHYHVNEQLNEYVIDLFTSDGQFVYDRKSTSFLRSKAGNWWYKDDLFVFTRLIK